MDAGEGTAGPEPARAGAAVGAALNPVLAPAGDRAAWAASTSAQVGGSAPGREQVIAAMRLAVSRTLTNDDSSIAARSSRRTPPIRSARRSPSSSTEVNESPAPTVSTWSIGVEGRSNTIQ